MDNPFVYGEVVPAAAFVNRVVELDRLVGDLAAGQKIFLISPRRYGKSSLIRHALAALARRGALTVEVTVSSFSSYVAFLEGYARALIAAETRWDRARTWLREVVSPARAEVRYAPDASPLGSLTVSFPGVRSDRDVSRLAQEVFALPGRLADRPPPQGRRRARRVPGDRRVQRRLGRARHARRRPAPARGRLRVRGLGAQPDGADARPEAAVLQGRPGDAAREDSRRRVRRVHRRTIHAGRASSPKTASARPSSTSPATCPTTSSAWRTKPGTKCARPGGGARRSTICTQALRRLLAEQEMMFEALWQRLTLAQRAVLRAVVLEDGRELLSADVRTRHRLGGASSVQAAPGGADARRCHRPRRRALHRRRFAAARVGRAADVLAEVSLDRSSAVYRERNSNATLVKRP